MKESGGASCAAVAVAVSLALTGPALGQAAKMVARPAATPTPHGAGSSGVAGQNQAAAANETRWVRPPSGYARASAAWGAPSFGSDASGERTTVTRSLKVMGYCPNINSPRPADDWNVAGLMNAGFKILEIDVVNLTDRTVTEDANGQNVLAGGQGTASLNAATKSVRVEWMGHSLYMKKTALNYMSGYSLCTSSYALRLKVQGPKGVNPFP